MRTGPRQNSCPGTNRSSDLREYYRVFLRSGDLLTRGVRLVPKILRTGYPGCGNNSPSMSTGNIHGRSINFVGAVVRRPIITIIIIIIIIEHGSCVRVTTHDMASYNIHTPYYIAWLGVRGDCVLTVLWRITYYPERFGQPVLQTRPSPPPADRRPSS